MSGLIVYAAKVKKRDVLYKSSSGGIFTALSNICLKQGDAIVCAVYDYTIHKSFFRILTTLEQRDEAVGSKYVQAEMGSIFRESELWLLKNPSQKIVFFGLGCQAAAFQKYMKIVGLGERVLIIDIICHGVPSPKIWQEYIKTIADKGNVTYINMRDKTNGWNKSSGIAIVKGKEVSIQDYRRLYSTRNMTRPSCYACPYTRISRSVDITIGDYWNVEKVIPDFYDPMGVSLVLIHSENGRILFEKAKQDLEFRLSNEKECRQPNLENPTAFPASRDQFWMDYEKDGIASIVNKYGKKKTLPQRVAKKIMRILFM